MKKTIIGMLASLALLVSITVNAADATFNAPGQFWSSGPQAAPSSKPFDTIWAIDLTTPFTMSIVFSTTNTPGLPGSGVNDTNFTITNVTGPPVSVFSGLLNDPSDFAQFVGVLLAGSYELRMWSATGGNTPYGGSYAVSASSAIVPLPAAFWLFGSALIGFIGFSRRRAV